MVVEVSAYGEYGVEVTHTYTHDRTTVRKGLVLSRRDAISLHKKLGREIAKWSAGLRGE